MMISMASLRASAGIVAADFAIAYPKLNTKLLSVDIIAESIFFRSKF